MDRTPTISDPPGSTPVTMAAVNSVKPVPKKGLPRLKSGRPRVTKTAGGVPEEGANGQGNANGWRKDAGGNSAEALELKADRSERKARQSYDVEPDSPTGTSAIKDGSTNDVFPWESGERSSRSEKPRVRQTRVQAAGDGVPADITEEGLRSFVAEHKKTVQRILLKNCEQTMKLIKDHTETLMSDYTNAGTTMLAVPTAKEVKEWPARRKSADEPDADAPAPMGRINSLLARPKKPNMEKQGSGSGGMLETQGPGGLLKKRDPQTPAQGQGQAVRSSLYEITEAHKEGMPAKRQGVFVDEDEMRRRVRERGSKPEYNVAEFYWDTGVCQQIARSNYFDLFTMGIITINAFWMAYDIDANTALLPKDTDPIFLIADNMFCFYFTAEWLIRFGAFKSKCNCLKDYWFLFDGALCTLMVVETWVLALLSHFAYSSTSSPDSSIIKTLRLAKMVRLARLARVLRSVPELLIVVKGIGVASRAVACTFFLLLFICYIFAIVMRQITHGTELGTRSYPSVPRAMRFLLTLGCAPDLIEPLEQSFDAGAGFALVFSLFIIVIVITVMNMLVGILVGVMHAVATVEKEEMLVAFVKGSLLAILEGTVLTTHGPVDENADGKISRVEFEKLCFIPEACHAFEQMGVDVNGLVELTDFIFINDRSVPFHDFMEMVLQLRGSNLATVKNIVDLRHFMVVALSEMHHAMQQGLNKLGSNRNSALSMIGEDFSEEEEMTTQQTSSQWLMAFSGSRSTQAQIKLA